MDEARLKLVIAAVLDIPASSVSEQTSADTVEDWTSLSTLNLVIALQDEFGIEIPDEDAATLTSYPIVRAVVLEQLSASEPKA